MTRASRRSRGVRNDVNTDTKAANRLGQGRVLGLAGLAGVVGVVGLGLGLGMHLPKEQAAGAAVNALSDDSSLIVIAPTEPRAPAAGVSIITDLSQLPGGPVERLEVAYFHRTHRCSGCVLAEELTRKTLDQFYADRIRSGEMVLLSEDVQAPADPELVRRYEAYGSALYLGVVKGGVTHVYDVDDIWYVLGDEKAFAEVLRGIIDRALSSQ